MVTDGVDHYITLELVLLCSHTDHHQITSQDITFRSSFF